MNFVTWDQVKTVGQIKALKTSFIFFLVVPIIAKVLALMPDQISVPYFDKVFELHIQLPFSWVAFFWAACCTSVGHLFYLLACPALIKEFSDYPNFTYSQRTGRYLQDTVNSITDKKDAANYVEKIQAINVKYSFNLDPYIVNSVLEGKQPVESSLFYDIRDIANISRPILKLVTVVAYTLGLIFISYVLFQNIRFVVQSM